MARKPPSKKQVEDLKHAEAKRKNIPTAEHQSVQDKAQQAPKVLRYPRNTDLDPQLVWRGKDEQDAQDLVVHAPPIYIQEKVHPKALIDDLLRQTRESRHEAGQSTADLFADFNGIPKGVDKTEFYQHDQNWTNRMILGDSLQVMASLAEREGLRGKVQCIYFDPPYGIKFNSNFQWSTTSRDVKDGKADHITREPEQVKAFRDTWKDGIHSYLTYLRDRLAIGRDLLSESGSLFVQIGDENIHRVRMLLDEVFGEENFCSLIQVQKTGSQAGSLLANTVDFILWYAKSRSTVKYRQLYDVRRAGHVSSDRYDQIELEDEVERRLSKAELQRNAEVPRGRVFQHTSLISSGQASTEQPFDFEGKTYRPGRGSHWKTTIAGLSVLSKAGRVASGATTVRYKRFIDDFSVLPITDRWESLQIGTGLIYVVQTATSVVERCLLMTSDPGDLVLDPTCGSGTTALVAEQWARRWITVDTSRVALALARARVMGARYPFYLLVDSREGQAKESEVTKSAPSLKATFGNVRHGFVYERVPHVTLKSIANNAEIDVIWENWQPILVTLREKLNQAAKKDWQEWEIPHEAKVDWPATTKKLHADWWQARIARQKEIDASIAAKAEFEYLYDKPYTDPKTVRVAGPFTVESLSPHRMLGVDENDELIDPLKAGPEGDRIGTSFEQMILENLKAAGVQQAHKEDRIRFTSLTGWPGSYICAEGRYAEGAAEKRAGIFIGPEFGTVSRPDLVEAAREAGDAGFDVLIACAFNYEAHANEFHKLGRIPVLKARMNADLHMAADLKATGKGNLFVIFGEPDIEILEPAQPQIRVKVRGVDVFDPSTGEVRSDDTDKIACWFIDTDYNGESFFVRHAYFLGQNDPYKALKTTLKAEIDEDAWASLNSDTSRPFPKPKSGRIAVKVINHLGDEVMKVFRV
ncbi:MAG: site-specific DNA-methyltransferase [Proteobacteria bacterium]|nr:site-specific DNA-methyltransferase [Pseudomonadota bacterium]